MRIIPASACLAYAAGVTLNMMSEKPNQALPYRSLGIRLKKCREKFQESVVEVSGAVEIEPTSLTEIEQGAKRPSEDILLLLLSHFGLKDAEATKMWELAGYDRADNSSHLTEITANQSVTAKPSDEKIIYTDMVQVMVNDYGLVMNFLQGAGLNLPPQAIARVGMSKEHAKSIIELLQKTLEQHDPKKLSAPDTSSDKQIKN